MLDKAGQEASKAAGYDISNVVKTRPQAVQSAGKSMDPNTSWTFLGSSSASITVDPTKLKTGIEENRNDIEDNRPY